jgi:hypothetical protein
MSFPLWLECALGRQGRYRAVRIAFFILALPWWASPSRAGGSKSESNIVEVDTEHMFGFTEGADIGAAGERQLESDSTFRAGRITGVFADIASQAELKYTAWQYFRISAAATFAYYDIGGVTGMDDRHAATVQSLSINPRLLLLDRQNSPFGLTLSFEPHWGFTDETTGTRLNHFGWEGLMAMDREIVPGRLFGALNLHFDTDRSQVVAGGATQEQPTLGIAGGVADQVVRDVWIGGEVRYFRGYDGASLNVLSGQAVYVGPTLFAKLSKNAWLSAAFDVQTWGRAVTAPGALDLVNFERYQMKFRVGYDF